MTASVQLVDSSLTAYFIRKYSMRYIFGEKILSLNKDFEKFLKFLKNKPHVKKKKNLKQLSEFLNFVFHDVTIFFKTPILGFSDVRIMIIKVSNTYL
jgi:hypothetical protein